MKFRVSQRLPVFPPSSHVDYLHNQRRCFTSFIKKLQTATRARASFNGGSGSSQGDSFLVPGATMATLLMLGVLHARRMYDDKKVEEARDKGIESEFQPDLRATFLRLLPLRSISRCWGYLASVVNNWNRFNINTGGTLVEKCCHFFDLMRLFAGANPVHVMASGAIDVNHKDEIYDGKVPDIIDNAYVIVEFDNGSRGMLDLCMFAEGTKNEQEISVVGDIGKGEAFVPESIVRFGTRAAGRDGVQTIKAEDDRIKYNGLHHGSSYLEHLNFLYAIRAEGERAPAVDLQDGLISVAIGVAAQLSIEKGRFVTIEEVME